ncbi:MAG: NarK/NasA family nitrate transporter [Nitrospira sp.]|nr:NarK/NasA family nitrate transporter [Nitrospira sp.]MBH0187540.1 NarK/NasA family nitrate transporter [Nitrospira sp.]
MSEIWHILRSGHWPSLVGAWLHLTVSFMVWLLVGAMSLSLATALQLTDQELAWLMSLPLLSGALLRMVAGWSADRLGARSTALAILLAELLVLCWGWLGVTGYGDALVFAACLGVAGASFSVALPIASRAYPAPAQGFVLGLTASGNIGTVLIFFLAPRWAAAADWHQVCGIMAVVVAVTLLAFVVAVPPTTPVPGLQMVAWWQHAAQLVRRRSAYWLCFLYAMTFGGFVGLCSLLPLLLHEVYHVDAIQAGTLAALCGLMGSLIRPVGGHVADRQGGLRTLYYVLPVIAGAVVAVVSPSYTMAVVMMVLATAAMGFGNGVVFQLVAEWFPADIGLASGVVGAAGAVGGFLLPILISTVKGVSGSYELGLWLFAGFMVCAWGTVMVALRAHRSSPAELSS